MNGVDRALAKLNGSAHGVRCAVDEFEHPHGVVFLPERGTSDVNHIIEMFELDGAVDAEVGSRAFWQRFIKRNFDIHRSLFHCRIYARDVAVRDSIARVDHGFLTDLNVLRLSLGDLDLRF